MQKTRLIIVGAGPIGLEAALRGMREGYDVTVLERGSIGQGVLSWGHVRFFTPFGMNSTQLGRSIASAERDEDAILSGEQFCQQYLIPIARSQELAGRVLENHEVIAVSRAAYGKSKRIGRPDRSESPFRILTRCPHEEKIIEADLLFDCTGFISQHNFIGAGGIPCPGELALPANAYNIPNINCDSAAQFAGKHTLVVGSGYSAATSVRLLSELTKTHSDTQIVWVTRGNRPLPIPELSADLLPERIQLTKAANQLAVQPDTCVKWLAGGQIQNIAKDGEQYLIELNNVDAFDNTASQGRAHVLRVDNIVANPGFRPNTNPFHELQIHRCYATDGPIKIAAHLLGQSSSDCLQQSAGGLELLRNPEPNFYIVGSASYGRDSRFLLQIGLRQIDELFSFLTAHRNVIS